MAAQRISMTALIVLLAHFFTDMEAYVHYSTPHSSAGSIIASPHILGRSHLPELPLHDLLLLAEARIQQLQHLDLLCDPSRHIANAHSTVLHPGLGAGAGGSSLVSPVLHPALGAVGATGGSSLVTSVMHPELSALGAMGAAGGSSLVTSVMHPELSALGAVGAAGGSSLVTPVLHSGLPTGGIHSTVVATRPAVVSGYHPSLTHQLYGFRSMNDKPALDTQE